LGRILLLIIIGFLIYLVFKGFFKSATKKREDEPRPPANTAKGEDMVTCARCGVNLPRSEAAEQDGKLVCRDNPKCLEVRG
jgi:uncharacterized protein